MEAGTYAWIVVSIFFVLFTAIQIRNCIKNVKCRGSSYEDMYPNFMPPVQLGQNVASIFTIAGPHVNGAPATIPAVPAYTNTGYQFTETNKTHSNDGLPTYEEVIARGPASTQHLHSDVTVSSGPDQAAAAVTTTSSATMPTTTTATAPIVAS